MVPVGETDPGGFLIRVVDEIIDPLEADGLECSGRADFFLLRTAAAQDAAKGHSSRAAAASNIQVSLEEGLRKRGRYCAENFEVQKQLELAEVERRALEWVGRKVRRREVTTTAHESTRELTPRRQSGPVVAGRLSAS